MSTDRSEPIYNYCDRWCERCFLTSRCSIFDRASIDLDQDNEAFWNSIGVQLEQAMQLLLDSAKAHGIDLNEVTSTDEERELIKDKNRAHPASKLSLRYAKEVSQWRRKHFSNDLIAADHSHRKAPSLKNCLEVVCWYEIFIHAKIMRALSGKDDLDDLEEYRLRDSDGSAKIALIAIERSIKAWGTIISYLPEFTSELISFIAMLEQLQVIVEDEFPKAWEFIRPGFDEG